MEQETAQILCLIISGIPAFGGWIFAMARGEATSVSMPFMIAFIALLFLFYYPQ